MLAGAALLCGLLSAQAMAQGAGVFGPALRSDAMQIEPQLERAPTIPSPASAGARFGTDMALSAQGTTAIIGAPLDGPGGTAWIYVRSGSQWTRQGPPLSGLEHPEPCNAEAEAEPELCRFGVSVALSGNGQEALIGVPRAHSGEGEARIYTRTGSSWAVGATLHAEGQTLMGHFGRSVALSSDGRTAVVGEPYAGVGHGAAWVFTRTGATWDGGTILRGSGLNGGDGLAYFGRSVAISGDGSTVLVGGPYDANTTGAVWAFTRSGEGWSQQGPKLTPEASAGRAGFGYSLALSEDGSTALIGAPNSDENVGAGYIFSRTAGAWSQQGPPLQASAPSGRSRLGLSVALAGDGEQALLGGAYDDDGAGAVWEFTGTGGAWSERARTTIASGENQHDHLGASVAIAADGSTALAGGPYTEAENGGVWSLDSYDFAPTSVSAVEPDSGPLAGGTRVTITGAGFLPGASVTIGEPAGEVEVLSKTEIKATTPPGGAGAAEVLVADDGGAPATGPSFTYLAPEEPPANTRTTKTGQTTSTPEPSSGTLASVESKSPTPQLGITGNLDPIAGHVRVKLPGSHQFSSITGLTQVPFGTVIDATGGTVTVSTIGAKGALQHISFYSGAFKLLQNKKSAEVLAVLEGGSFASCPRRQRHASRAEVASSRKRVVRKLWASGHGNYTTKGSYAAGAVVGTKWLTVDRCDGTLIYVATDAVSVTNLVTHRHVLVQTHHSYFAAAP